MNSNLKNEILDVALIGSGVMSANLGALLKSMDSKLKIELYEVTEDLSEVLLLWTPLPSLFLVISK